MSYFNKRASLIRNAFGSFIAEKDGVNVCIKCPKCGKHTSQKKKLVIKIDDGKFHCWVCGLKGSNISYLFRKYAPSHASKATEVFGGPKASFNRESLEEEKIDLAADLKGFTFLGDVRKNSDPDLKDVVRYAKKRGITTYQGKVWNKDVGSGYDLVMMRGTIEHFLDPITVLKKCSEI